MIVIVVGLLLMLAFGLARMAATPVPTAPCVCGCGRWLPVDHGWDGYHGPAL